MSYSLSAKAANKELAKQAVAEQFDKIAANQPMHARDRAAVLANANAVIDLLADDDTRDVAVSGSGYLGWGGTGEVSDASPISAASVSFTANHAIRLQPPGA